MLSAEREKEIREQNINGPETELLAEIDRLRIWSSDSHVTELEEKINKLQTELGLERERFNKLYDTHVQNKLDEMDESK